jgi:hypothetical protein
MNTSDHPSNDGDAPIEVDVLLSRAVAGDSAALDEIRARGQVDPAILIELTLWQADELRLARVARDLHAVADRVDVPESRRRMPIQAGIGWAVAAAIAIAWGSQTFMSGSASQRASVAGIGSVGATADDAFEAYLARARAEGLVTGEVAPPTLLRSRELGDGRGFEVVIVRQVIERRISPEMYRFAPIGETGRLRQVIIRPRTDLVQ